MEMSRPYESRLIDYHCHDLLIFLMTKVLPTWIPLWVFRTEKLTKK